jgi:hypothetical protein
MDQHDYWEFEHNAFHRLVTLNEHLERTFKAGSYERWDYDLETCEFVFSDNGIPKVVAKFQAVGSFSSNAKTWLWSWANASIPKTACDQIHRVREFGVSHGVVKLTEPKWSAEEADGWEMAAVATVILGGKGVYRCPNKNGLLFIVFTDIHFAEN